MLPMACKTCGNNAIGAMHLLLVRLLAGYEEGKRTLPKDLLERLKGADADQQTDMVMMHVMEHDLGLVRPCCKSELVTSVDLDQVMHSDAQHSAPLGEGVGADEIAAVQ